MSETWNITTISAHIAGRVDELERRRGLGGFDDVEARLDELLAVHAFVADVGRAEVAALDVERLT